MVGFEENERLGMVLPIITKKYGIEKADKLVDAARKFDTIAQFPAEVKAMVDYGISVTDMETGKPKKAAVKKAMMYSDIKKKRNFEPVEHKFIKSDGTEIRFTKYNPYHDRTGRFAAAHGATSYSVDRSLKGDHALWGEEGSISQFIGADGKLTKERAALYSKLISEKLQAPTVPEGQRTMDFMGGGGGSGKGYTISTGTVKVPGEDQAAHINSDDVKVRLPEFRQRAASDDVNVSLGAANFVHEESAVIEKLMVKATTAKGCNIVVDGTAKDPKKVGEQTANAKKNGYNTRAHYIATPLDVAIKSNEKRYYENSNKEERRMVPKHILIEAHKEVSRNIFKLADCFDEVEIVTNDHRSAPKQIAYKDSKSGKLVITDQTEMDKFVAKKDA